MWSQRCHIRGIGGYPTRRFGRALPTIWAMTTRAQFNAEQWAVITTAPVLAGTLVIAADRGGSVRESLAMSQSYAAARSQEPGELLAAILATPPSMGPANAPKTPEELAQVVPAQLRQALRALELVATDDEVVAYKRFVYGLAEAVARAHKEGGFLGIGGKEISPSEQAALDQIAAIFDEPVPAQE
jgi:hypothetical protein